MTSEEKIKHDEMLSQGIMMAVSAANALGGRLEIRYTPISMQRSSGVVEKSDSVRNATTSYSDASQYLKHGETDVEIFKSVVIDGLTYSQAANRYKVKYSEPSKSVVRVMFAIQNELLKSEYDEAPYQPSRTTPSGGRIYNTHLHHLRKFKYFFAEVLNKMDKEQMLIYISKYYK